MKIDSSNGESASLRQTAVYIAICVIIIGSALRIWTACNTLLWVDEAESSINALTILDKGLPLSEYLGQPIFENTLTLPFPESEEYEFKDSSYSEKGLTVYHGWLPLYSIALSQLLLGVSPDHPSPSLQPKHSTDDIFLRTFAPRLPALFFSAGYLTVIFFLVRSVAGSSAAITSLIWLSINIDAIKFGHQARYYSLTLLLSATCALAAWNLYKHGRLKHYLWLGLAEAALFHTHQLSAVVFAVTCLLLLPRIITHEQWLKKCIAAASVAALLTVPWALWSGFFTTASEVPKAYELFTNYNDWLNYFIERPIPLIVIMALLAAYLLSQLLSHYLSPLRALGQNESYHAILFLLAWLSVAFIAFHLLVPAASFFFERLSLIATTPFACLLGIIISYLLPKRTEWVALIPASLAALLLLSLNNNLPKVPSKKRDTLAPVFNYLHQLPERASNRVYATPNEHLVWTYYTGIPVQSIAPIRQSFLENYNGRILYLKSELAPVKPEFDEILEASLAAGIELNASELLELKYAIQRYFTEQDLLRRGIIDELSDENLVAEHLEDYIGTLRSKEINEKQRRVRSIKNLAIFKDLPFQDVNELWMAFFYRFVDPESRIGVNSNIRSVERASQVTLFPECNTIIFERELLAKGEP